jgi:CRP-like cAMP-binding protein/small-conductance mechanosensitive channel
LTYAAEYWIAGAVLLLSLALWPFGRERSRLRTCWGLLFLGALLGVWLLFPPSWRPRDKIAASAMLALLELAAVQIAVVFVFDVLLRRVRIPKFASEMAIVASYVAIVLHMLIRVGVNVSGIFATSAVAAAVIGFALQEMLSNIAGGIALELEGGINPGDFIQVGEHSGFVRHVRLRHTAIDTPDGDVVTLPNSQLTRSAVRIFSRAHRRLVPFAMSYAADPHRVTAVVEDALRGSPLEGVATTPAPQCVLQEMATGFIAYSVAVWFTKPGDNVDEISAVLTRIYFGLRRAGMPASEITTLLEVKRSENIESGGSETPDAVEVLRRTPIFRLLEEDDLHQLASDLEHLSFASGEHIIRQGEEGDSMYFIVQGRVAILLASSDGVERQVSVMEPGEFFGESSLLTGEARNATALALTRVDCYRLDKAGLQGFIQRLPELAEDMSAVMAHRRMELNVTRQKLDRETALRREAEEQGQLLTRIRRFFES